MPKKKAKRTSRGSSGNGGGLSDLGRNWKDTVARVGGGGFPIGQGQEGIIRSTIIEQSQEKKNWMVTWVIEGTSEGIEGKKHYKRSMIQTEENREYLRGEMETIGLTWPDDINGLGDALAESDDLAIGFDVVQGKDEFVNLYFNEALEGGDGSSGPVAPADDNYTKKDIKSLGRKADKDDTKAIDELTTLAKESKINSDDYDTWAEVADEVIDDLGL